MVTRRKRKHYYLYIKSRGLAGIYIHIPFCRQACHYCNFHFSTSLKNSEAMVEAIIKEIDLRKDFLPKAVDSVYFGGGTPSILNNEAIRSIIKQVDEVCGIETGAEITLEANPEDVSLEKAKAWKDCGVNRVSLGIQTLNDEALKSLNRVHSGAQGLEAIAILQKAGLENITIDLMYGLPGQDLANWQANLERIIAVQIPHISAYALTIESKTVFGHREQKGQLRVATDEQYEAQYSLMCKMLKEAGYEHYEVSNFARPGHRSRHNQAYWQGKPYLGIGPGAHSYDGRQRLFNLSNNVGYLRLLNNNQLASEAEEPSDDQQYNEYLLTRLRTSAGIDLNLIREEFKTDIIAAHQAFIDQCIQDKLANFEKGKFILTEKGFFVSDAIILELMK